MSEQHTTHAFLTDNTFEFRHEGWRVEPFNLGDFAGADRLIDRIFAPSLLVWLRSKEITAQVQAILNGASERYDIKTPDDRDYYTITRKSDGAKLSINTFQKLSKTWEVDHDKNDVAYECETLERAFTRFQEAFQIKFGYNRGQQGVYILERWRKSVGARKGETDEALIIPPKGMEPFTPNVSDLYFFRDLTKEEKRMTRLIAVDKNSAYPTAASIKLGLVDYDHCIKPKWEGNAGYYKVTSDFCSNELLPPVLPRLNGKAGWYDAPVLRLLTEMNVSYEIEEAYIFTHQSAVLDKWGRTLREAANSLGDDRESKLLRKIIKTTANATIGAFSAPPKPGSSRWYYRPDWRNAIISEHAARTYRDLITASERGFHAAAIYNDCLYIPCDKDFRSTLPFLTDERLSRKYKLAGVYDISSRAAKKLFSAEHKNLPHEIAPYAINE